MEKLQSCDVLMYHAYIFEDHMLINQEMECRVIIDEKAHTHKNTPFMWDMINFIVWSDVMKLQLIISAT